MTRPMTEWSPLARANPLVLVSVGLLAVPASLGVRDAGTAAVAVGLVGLLALGLVPGLARGAWRLLAPAMAALSVAWSSWLLGGHDVDLAVTAAGRVLVLSLPGVLLAPLVDPFRLGDQLGQRLRLPARPVVAFVAGLQQVERLGEVWGELDRARRARGLGPSRSPLARMRHAAALTFALLVATLRGAGRQAVAMDARGFAAARRRTWAEPATWSRTDTVVLLAATALAALPWLLPG